MLAKVNSAAIVGLEAIPVEVEVDIASQGLPAFNIVGLPDKAVEEAKERVRSALKNSGADFPAKRITVNLAPADLPKEGPAYDLPIAIGILLASCQLQKDVTDSLFAGELSLDGRVRSTTGMLCFAMLAKKQKNASLFLPKENAKEAAIVDGISIYPIATITNLFNHLAGISVISPQPITDIADIDDKENFDYDLKDIKGQEQARRAMEVAASGGHNMLLKGPPGAGKTLLARTLPSILPLLTLPEALEVTQIYSISDMLNGNAIITNRPFRAPHHTTSHVGLIGGGSIPRPGEISLAHRGVLFLDELPEFSRFVLEALRQPLEDNIISIARSHSKVAFPAKCMVVAAQNPCPCGYFGDPLHTCKCSSANILKYKKRVSGPLLDRIDIHLDVPAVKIEKLSDTGNAETSKDVRKRVQKARDIQTKRYKHTKLTTNADISVRDIKEFCQLSNACTSLLAQAVKNLKLSARSYHRTIKVSRTIADLAGSETIEPMHLAEALQYRPKTDALS